MDSQARNSYLARMRAILSVSNRQLDELAALRHRLHQQPELSTREERTASLIVLELERAGADQVLTGVGGTGVVGVFDSGQPGSTLVLRCELDALPISEPEDFGHDYRSQSDGVSHKCGHDGHMAILIGVARALGRRRPAGGKVALLFQPAEETGEGAPAVLADARFKALEPDFIIGFHNLPRHAMHSICLRKGTFASASEGFRLQLTGAFSHSSYPEHGRSPAGAVAELLAALPELPASLARSSDLLMLTITQAVLGEKGPKMDFGVAPGVAEICGVIRAHRQQELEALEQAIAGLAGQVCEREGLTWDLSWHEAFPATVNHDASVELIRDAAAGARMKVEMLDEPFRWSEDFSHYLQQYPGAFFGIGSGVDQPQLHNEYYDFPDELIPTGITVCLAILDSILGWDATPATGSG
jgi:amidohydrolase